jgi:hypothetical protein
MIMSEQDACGPEEHESIGLEFSVICVICVSALQNQSLATDAKADAECGFASFGGLRQPRLSMCSNLPAERPPSAMTAGLRMIHPP